MTEAPPVPLFPYQQRGAEFLATHPKAILADPMGSGKTRTFIAVADQSGAHSIIHSTHAIARQTAAREWQSAQTILRSVQVIESADGVKNLRPGV